MMNEDERAKHLTEEFKRGQEAEKVLNNPIVVEALVLIRAELYNKFSHTSFEDGAKREEIWRKHQTVDWFESVFKQAIQTGQMAQDDLSAIAKIKKKVSNLF